MSWIAGIHANGPAVRCATRNLEETRVNCSAALPKSARHLLAGLLGLAIMAVSPSMAGAACLQPNNVAIKVRFPDYPMWKGVGEAMRECGNVEVRYDFDAASAVPLTASNENLEAHLVGVSNGGLFRLSRAGLIRPLDELVERYSSRLADHQLIRVDGRVVAIAVAANTMLLAYHDDLFLQVGIGPPASHNGIFLAEQFLMAEENRLYEKGFSLPLRLGWSLTQAFFDQFLADGGQLFDDESRPLIASARGEAAVQRLKDLAALMPAEPDPPLDTGPQQALENIAAFRVPMGLLWASSAAIADSPATSRVAGKLRFEPAPAIRSGAPPASTLWWDGFAISIAASEEEAEAAFRVALEGLDEDMLQLHGDRAAWLIPGYRPGRLTSGVMKAIEAGIPAFPASEHADLLRRALAPHLADAMEGKMEIAAALQAAVADFERAARERGLKAL